MTLGASNSDPGETPISHIPWHPGMAGARSLHVKLASGPRLTSENRESAEWEVRVFFTSVWVFWMLCL